MHKKIDMHNNRPWLNWCGCGPMFLCDNHTAGYNRVQKDMEQIDS